MHLTRPPHRLHRQMPFPRPVPELGSGLASDLDLATVTAADESERSVMQRILTCDRVAWEAAERCAALRREQSALLRAQASNSQPELAPSPHGELLAGILNAQLQRNSERLECAEQTYRSATQLLRETITDALARRMAPAGLARRIETLDEADASGGIVAG
jgi:hypothetical protein